ncbi:hypothetical protein BC835DRAFT_1417733 [Cytidiella melzeri]|nr:hypothetical protein BC835DRAFT_1417733 [Cytidiella melzeri]
MEALTSIEEDEIGLCSLLQPPRSVISSRSSDAFAKIMGYYTGCNDTADGLNQDIDTPALSPATDTSDDEGHGSPLGTPTLIDGHPFVDDAPPEDFESMKILSDDAESCTEDSEHVEQYYEANLPNTEEVDGIDTLIARITGYTPRKLVFDVDALVQSPEQMSLTDKDELDDIDATIASHGDSVRTARSWFRLQAPHHLLKASLPVLQTRSAQRHRLELHFLGIRNWISLSAGAKLDMGLRLSGTFGFPAVSRSLHVSTSPGIGQAVDTSATSVCAALPSLPRGVSKRLAAYGSGTLKAAHRQSRVVSSPPAVPVSFRSRFPPLQGSTTKAPPPRRFSTSLKLQVKASLTRNAVVSKSFSTTDASTELQRPSSGPTAPISSSIKRRLLIRSASATTMPLKSASPLTVQATKRSVSSRKLLVTFDLTPTPDPEARAVWGSYSPRPSSRTKPAVGDLPTRSRKP